MAILVRAETPDDVPAVRQINLAAFGNDAEADLVEALRNGGHVVASLVAELHGEVVGHILFSHVQIHTANAPVAAVSLAPMAVAPAFQSQGIGSLLVVHGLEACRKLGHEIVVVLGHVAFYPRFGFQSALAERIESPFGGGKSWMALELTEGALTNVRGKVEYSPPFKAFE